MAQGLQSVSNFLVPATGSTNAYMIRQEFSATPFFQDFNNQGLDGIPFRPSGVIIDNSAGTGPLNVLINEMSFQISCPAGAFMTMPYPAPLNCTANITGSGVGTVIFVDYPVIPWTSAQGGGGGNIPDPLPVTGPLTDDELRASPLPVSLPAKTALTATMAVASAAGNTVAGARMVSFENTGTGDATVAGGVLSAGKIVTFEAPSDSTISAIAYDGTGTTLQIATLS